MSTLYPVGLDLAGRRVVVAGGGSVAQRRVAGLLEVGADVVVVSPALTTALEALADSREITWEAREYAAGDLDDAWYCVAATDSPEVNAAVAAAAEARRVFCVRADAAEDGTAVTPAVGRYDDVTVARARRRRPPARGRGARRRRRGAAQRHPRRPAPPRGEPGRHAGRAAGPATRA